VVSCMQHGSTAGYFEYYELCKENNLKMLYGVETYLSLNTNKEDRTNAHLCVMAVNPKGFKTINKLLSKANVENFYYKARISLEWLLELNNPEDLWITTACVGGVWKYYNYEDIILKLHSKFKDNFFLEFGYHNTESQKDINKKILFLSNKYNIQTVVGCDSHMIYESEKKYRTAYLYAKGIVYEDEEGWFLDYPDYNTIVERFETQGVVPQDIVKKSIENTNLFENLEEITITKDIKIPSMFPDKTIDEKNNILIEIIRKELINEFGNIKNVPIEYQEAIKKEFQVIRETNMADYFILNYNIIKLGKQKGGKLTLTSRGSCPSWYINKILGFTTVNRLKSPVTLYPERFATTARVLSGSIFDLDFNVANREAFIEAQTEILGKDNAHWFSTYGTLKIKSAFKMYAKANDIPFEISNNIIKYIDKYEQDLKYADDDEKENIIPDSYIPKEYLEIFQQSKNYNGIIDSISVHPCSFLLLSNPISEEIGLIKSGDFICANIIGKYADKYMYMKNDLLAVTVVDIIYKTFEKIGIEPINTENLMKIVKDDKKTWDIFSSGHTIGINQFEQNGTKLKAIKYKCKNVAEATNFVAAIRPSFQSMIDVFLNREEFSYGIETFDKLLITKESDKPFLLMQEQIMQTLNFAGFDIKECYQLIKSVAKKKQGVIEPIKNRFIEGFAKKIMEDEGGDAQC